MQSIMCSKPIIKYLKTIVSSVNLFFRLGRALIEQKHPMIERHDTVSIVMGI